MNRLARLLWFLIGLLVFCFAILAVNQDPASLRFLVWRSPEASLFWWLLAAFVLGLLVGGAAITLLSVRGRMRERTLSRELSAQQRELDRLKSGG